MCVKELILLPFLVKTSIGELTTWVQIGGCIPFISSHTDDIKSKSITFWVFINYKGNRFLP